MSQAQSGRAGWPVAVPRQVAWGFESPTGSMSDSPPDDDDGRTVIPLAGRPQVSRRDVLLTGGSAIAAMVGSSLYASAADQHTVGADNAVAGGAYRPSMHELSQSGTLAELIVVARAEHFPDSPSRTPALWLPLDGVVEMHTGTGTPSGTSTLYTNVGSVVTRSAFVNTGGGDVPSLKIAEDGVGLVIDGAPSQRSSVGGGTDYLDGADTAGNLPTRSSGRYAQFPETGAVEVQG